MAKTVTHKVIESPEDLKDISEGELMEIGERRELVTGVEKKPYEPVQIETVRRNEGHIEAAFYDGTSLKPLGYIGVDGNGGFKFPKKVKLNVLGLSLFSFDFKVDLNYCELDQTLKEVGL